MNKVVISACGIVSPLGVGIKRFAQRMLDGESGVRNINGTLVASNFPVHVAAIVPREELCSSNVLKHIPPEDVPNSWKFAALATEEAVADLNPDIPIDAIVYGTSDGINFDIIKESFRAGGPACIESERLASESATNVVHAVLKEHGNSPVSPTQIIPINNGCISGNQAIGIAFLRIRSGEWTRAVVGGVESRCTDYNLMDFHLLGALTMRDGPDASRPFSGSRSGFVRGEGAATLILESEDAAKARGATVLGYVTGYAATADAYRLTDGHPECRGAVKAMENCLRIASLEKDSVDAISAHGTSTQMNDRLETAAIKAVFGARAQYIPVTSLKSQVGHATVAAGALEAVSCLIMLERQVLAPTINYDYLDPDCNLDYVPNQSRPASLRTILSNNFGFGGQNACVLFERAAI
jgi:3-oxoacyl-[acyl-carrier-protein] synthase II